ncbi:MAG: 50S ribosomal protein L15 [Synergistaceae bacterium]|nr:50S ribosomal protein L15 [Synergistaceae bacterium]
MNLHDLRPALGSKRRAKRLGQGLGSGTGKTSGKGHKGHKARTGGGVRPGFEGGQMPLTRRTPKRGFNNARFAKVFQVVNIESLDKKFEAGQEVNAEALKKARLIESLNLPVKVLGKGEINKSLNVKAAAFSKGAEEKIKAAGGTAEVI